MIKDFDKIEKQVLKKITPSPKERKEIEEIVTQLIKDVEQEIKKYKLNLSIELVGSIAKGTYIKNNTDIDLFILFPPSVSRAQLQQTGLSIGRAILKNQEECFAEHPYIRGTYNGVITEIVPCYKIESATQKLSAVDRTPLHTKYIRQHLLESQKKNVLLFKQFLKGIGCYGAEAEIEGFSGYLCEILIIKYSNFRSLISDAQNWCYGHKITLQKGKTPDFKTPIVFIDPVDIKRNVSSAVSEEKFNHFLKASREYIKKPRITFFFPKKIKPWDLKRIKKELGEKQVIAVKIKKPSIISENLFPQVRKAVRSINELCERLDFTILDYRFYINENEIYMLLYPKNHKISKTKIHMGPPVEMKKNADDFINRWTEDKRTIKNPFEKKGRLYVEIKREYTEIGSLLRDQVKNLSLGKHIDKIVKKNYVILNKDDLLIEKLRVFWTEYLDKKTSWER